MNAALAICPPSVARTGIRPGPAALRGLNFDVLRTYPVRVAVSPTHALAHARGVELDRLRSERLIGYTRKDYPEYHAWVNALFDGKIPQLAEEHDSVSSLIAAVESGRGVALVSQSLACLAGPRLKLIGRKQRPGQAELERNPRARSALLRVAERLP